MQGIPEHFEHPQDQARYKRPLQQPGLELYQAQIVGHHFAPHRHEGYGLGVIEAGAERFHYAGQEHLAPAGAIVLMQPGELHTGGPAAPGGWRYRMLYLDEAVLAQALAGEPRSTQVWRFAQAVHLEPARALALRHSLLQLWQASTALALDDALQHTLGLLRPLAAPTSAPGALRPAAAPAARFSRVRERLADRTLPEPSLAELALLAGMSPFHLQRSFKAAHQASPHQWRMAQMMAEAKGRLARGQAPAEVAAAVGLADQAHLTRRFAGMYGTTPARYQRDLGLRSAHRL